MKLTTDQRLHMIAEISQYSNREAVNELIILAKDTGLHLETLRHAANKKHLYAFADDSVGKAA